jgi:hypothetical protein
MSNIRPFRSRAQIDSDFRQVGRNIIQDIEAAGLIENLPPPTETEIDAFYSAREWEAAKAVCHDREGFACAQCHTFDGEFDVDHIVPVRECWHLRLVQSNLQNLCKRCHREKHAHKEAAE